MKHALLVSLLFLASCGWDPGPFPTPPADDPFDDAALAARVERVRPDVEAVLGRELGDVEVVVADSDEWADHRTTLILAQVEERDRERELAQWVQLRYFVSGPVALTYRASVFDGDGDRVWLIAETLQDVSAEQRDDTLDLLLAHEMAHVAQNRFLGLGGTTLEATDEEADLARRAIVEGHAQWVERRVAERRGIEGAFLSYELETDGAPPAGLGPTERQEWTEMAAVNAFAYGEGERFVTAVIDALGYDDALTRLATTPPTTVREVLEPRRYLDGEAPHAEASDARDDVLTFFGADLEDREAVLSPVVAERFAGLGDEARDAALREVVGCTRVAITLPHGRLGGVGGTLTWVQTTSEPAARRFAAMAAGALERPGAVLKLQGPSHEVVETYLEDAPWGAHLLVRLQRVDQADASEGQVLLVPRGRRVVELALEAPHDEAEAAARLAAQLIALLDDPSRLAEVWGLRDDAEHAADLEGALDDPDPDVRLTALRALGPTGWFPRADEAARSAMENDPDPDVRATFLVGLRDHVEDEAATSVVLRALEADHPGPRRIAALAAAPFAEDPAVARALLDLLDHDDAQVRLRALAAIVAGDQEERLARPALGRLTRDPDAHVRALAVAAARNVLPGAKERAALREIHVEAVADPSAAVRLAGWKALLLDIDPLGRRPLPPTTLRRGIEDPVVPVRMAVASALLMRSMFDVSRGKGGEGGPLASVPGHVLAAKVRRDLKSPDLNTRGTALVFAEHTDYRLRTLLPLVVEQLEVPTLRYVAASLLGRLGERATKAVPALGRMLVERRGRQTAAEALGSIGADARDAVPALEALRTSPHVRTRIAAVKALHDMGAETEGLVDTLLALLDRPEMVYRSEALRALDAMDASGPDVQAAMRPILAAPQDPLHYRALGVLEDAGPLDPATREVVAAHYCDPDRITRDLVRDMVDPSDGLPPRAVDGLKAALEDEDPETRNDALLDLVACGACGTSFVPALVMGMDSRIGWVRAACAWGLAWVGRGAIAAVPRLVAALDDEVEEVAEHAASALGEVRDGLDPSVVLRLAEIAVDGEHAADWDARSALETLGQAAAPAVPFLVETLEGGTTSERVRACQALRDMGPVAREALPALRKALTGEDRRVPYFARRAIEEIEGSGASD